MRMVLITGLHCSRFTRFCPELKSGVVVTGVALIGFGHPSVVGGRWQHRQWRCQVLVGHRKVPLALRWWMLAPG
jgi:hypothetical protein